MNARTMLAVPYKLYRVPLAVVDEQVAHRLPADSAPRLVFDRALGSYDRLAGRLLCDVAVAEQGATGSPAARNSPARSPSSATPPCTVIRPLKRLNQVSAALQ